MKLSRATIALYVGLVFASGVVLGVFGERLYRATTVNAVARPNPEEYRKQVIAEFQSRLKLDGDQVSRLNAIMDETRARVTETRKQMHPAYQKIHEESSRTIALNSL